MGYSFLEVLVLLSRGIRIIHALTDQLSPGADYIRLVVVHNNHVSCHLFDAKSALKISDTSSSV